MAKKAVAKKTGGQINSGQINSGKMYRWQNVVVAKCQWQNVKWPNYSGELSVTHSFIACLWKNQKMNELD